MSAWAAIRLVAAREVRVRLQSKAYRITTLLLTSGIVGLSVIAAVASGDEGTTVGVADESLVAVVERAGAQVGAEITGEVVAPDAARAAVLDGEVPAWVSAIPGGGLRVMVERDLDAELGAALDAAVRQAALEREVVDLGGDPAGFAEAVAGAKAEVEPLREPRDYEPQQLFLGAVAGVLIFVALQFAGQMVAQGIVEEKTSRVVELLLATIRPIDLMTGKVLGIGLVGLGQVAVITAAGVAAALGLDTLTLPAGATVAGVVWLLVWFVFGFTIYALLAAGFAALVSRQEDVNAVVAPVMVLMMVGYIAGVSILPNDPDDALAGWLSLVPFFAPTMMPIRMAIGGVPTWEVVASLGLAVAMVPLLLWLAGRMYRNAVMRTGTRVRLRDALRTA